jgi:hypothetical protein
MKQRYGRESQIGAQSQIVLTDWLTDCDADLCSTHDNTFITITNVGFHYFIAQDRKYWESDIYL